MATFNLPPRQKMINLLYVILIAMLAINISSDVLDGFITSNKDMEKNILALQEYSAQLNSQMAGQGKDEQLAKVDQAVQQFTEEIGRMKEEIRKVAQESNFAPGKTDADDDLNAVKTVMLGEHPQAGMVKNMIEDFKALCLPLVDNENSRALIANLLNTDVHNKNHTWEKEHFDNLPAVGGIMMLNKVERDLWTAANETKRNLGIEPDTIGQKSIETPGVEIDNSLIKALVTQLEKRNAQNTKSTPIIKDKTGKIKAVVITENQAPLFANYENILNITVATGNNTAGVKVAMTGGSVKKEKEHYIAIPDGSMDKVTLTVTQNGNKLVEHQYNVVPLPTPKPFLTYTTASGKQREYRSNVPMSASELASINEIGLKMDAGIHTGETVQEFDMIIIKNGNKTIITEHAQGGQLTQSMKRSLKGVVKGDKLFFSNIIVKGEHTKARQTLSLNVIPF